MKTIVAQKGTAVFGGSQKPTGWPSSDRHSRVAASGLHH